MDDYISRQVILKHLEKCKGQPPEMCYTFAVLTAIESFVKSQPAADVAPVVRCKECEFHTFLGKCKVHSQEPDQYGPGHDVTMAPDDFCSYGKRKQLEE